MPVFLQSTSSDCGAACLAMVARARGIGVRPSDVRAVLPQLEDAVSARELLEAARALGLRGRAFATSSVSALREVGLPFVAWWRGHHFVVVDRIGADGVRVADPARGRVVLSRSEFDEAFSGVVLSFDREPTVAPGVARARTPVGLTLPSVRQVVGVVLLSLCLQAMAALSPLMTRGLVDRAQDRAGTSAPPAVWGVGIGVCVAAVYLALWARSRTVIAVRLAMSRELLDRVVGHVLRLPFTFFLKRTSADVVGSLQAAELVREFLSERVVTVLLDCLAGVAYLVAIFVIAPPLGLVCTAAVAAFAVLAALTARSTRNTAQAALLATAEAQSHLLEAVSGIETVRSSEGAAYVLARWRAASERAHAAISRRDHSVSRVERLSQLIQYGTGALLLLGAFVVLRAGGLGLGDLLALAALGAGATTATASVLQAVQQLSLGSAYLERIRELLDEDEERRGTRTPTGAGEVEVRAVTFHYGPSAPVLSQVSMRAAPGTMVGVVGASGSGKTTLVRLLAGLLAPTAGEVLLDGVPVDEVDRQALCSLVAVVPQHPVVLSGSVADNVTFGRPVDRARVEVALRQAALYDEVRAWRLGPDTPLGESGSRLSGGQRQRLALARALYGRPRLLVLDEPTSGLDALTERVVQDSLADYGCTRIVISHRLATLAGADRIYVLDGGRTVDEGTPAELGSRDGLYRQMAARQGLVRPGPAT